MSMFRSPMINLYSRDLARAMSFYTDLGFVETFRTPASGPPEHVVLELDGFTLGIATVEAARGHGLRLDGDGRWICWSNAVLYPSGNSPPSSPTWCNRASPST